MLNDRELRQRSNLNRKVLVMYSWFMEVLADPTRGVSDAQRQTRRAYQGIGPRRGPSQHDIFKLERMVVPINIGNSHWTLVLIDFKNKSIHYYDSRRNDTRAAAHGNKYCSLIRTYLAAEWNRIDRGNQQFIDRNWTSTVHQAITVPQQHNGFDCGVFVCAFAIVLTHLHLNASDLMSTGISQDRIGSIRGKLAKFIVQEQID